MEFISDTVIAILSASFELSKVFSLLALQLRYSSLRVIKWKKGFGCDSIKISSLATNATEKFMRKVLAKLIN